MKRILFGAFALLLATSFTSETNAQEDKGPAILEIGAKAPMTDLKMEDISGKMLSLTDIAQKNGVLVVFSCNTCPYVVGGQRGEGWEGRYTDVLRSAMDAGVGMVLVNSNEAKRGGDDSMEEMKAHAREKAYRARYVMDTNHQLADAFGARTTPHVYLFNSDMELVYKGAIDDSFEGPDKVKEPWLKNALNNLKEGKPIDPNSTRQLGCSIKRVS